MSELKHTPGPWTTEYRKTTHGGYAQEVFDATGKVVASAAWYPVRISETTTGTNRAANARLMAAAPEMLEVLEHVRDAMEASGGWTGDEQVFALVVEAILKATGEPA